MASVLDKRAMPDQRYYGAMRAALPEMPETDSLEAVVDFIYRTKGTDYFKEEENSCRTEEVPQWERR